VQDNHVIRMAGRIHRQLFASKPGPTPNWHRVTDCLLYQLGTLENCRRRADKAACRGWSAAAALCEQEVVSEAARIELTASLLAHEPVRATAQLTPAPLGLIVAELNQLREEFENFTVDFQLGVIGVQTERIVLEEIDLGPFVIELHVPLLDMQPGSRSFRCVAVDPNPASSTDQVTHPHVRDGELCAGDASVPITAALNQGRIADAFVLVRSVLQTYNPDSPFVSLTQWSGVSCAECGYFTDSTATYFCEGCDHDVCEDCYSCCDNCGNSFCRGCLERDSEAETSICSDCQRTCGRCGRTVDEDHFDSDLDLCPGCSAEDESNQQQEVPDEQPSSTGCVAAPVDAGVGVDGVTQFSNPASAEPATVAIARVSLQAETTAAA
jgi:hypothetical protein